VSRGGAGLNARYIASQESFRYIVTGTLDEHERLPPKGEFFCQERESWMPEIPSKSQLYRQDLC
jgi:hypothetical protein